MGGGIYERNIETIRKRAPRIADAIDSAGTHGLALERTRSGRWTIRFGDRYLVSRYDPVREVEKRASDFWREPPDLAAFFGFGLGYQFDFIPRSFDGHIVIYEPVAGALKLALGVRDFTGLFGNPKLALALEPTDLVFDVPHMFGFKVDTKIALFDLLAYRSLFPDELAAFRDRLEKLEADKDIHQQTAYVRSKLWSRYIFENIAELLSCPGIELLRRRFSGQPCVVIASGPSLDESLPHLHKLKGRALLVACGSTMRALLNAGISPELAVAIEANDIAYQFEGLDLSGTYLALITRAYPELWRLSPRGFFGFAPAERMDAMLLEMFGRASILDVGGSVSTAAFEIARLVGANPIVLVGLDLAFDTSGRSHASGCGTGREDFYGELVPERANVLKRYGIFFVEGQSGEPVPTRLAWMDYLFWFERHIAALKEKGVRVINTSARGSRIHGAERGSLADVSKSLEEKIDFLGAIDELVDRWSPSNIDAGWQRLLAHLPDLTKLARLAQKLQARYASAFEKFTLYGDLPSEREDRRIRKLEAELKRLTGRLDAILSPLIQQELFIFHNCFEDVKETGDRKAISHLFNRAQLLYGGIHKAACTASEWIEQAYERWIEKGRKGGVADGEAAYESGTIAENI